MKGSSESGEGNSKGKPLTPALSPRRGKQEARSKRQPLPLYPRKGAEEGEPTTTCGRRPLYLAKGAEVWLFDVIDDSLSLQGEGQG
jgi:hypothetical protein